MLLSLFDKKFTNAYVRLVNYWHPTPPMAENYAPATTTPKNLPVVDYVRQLIDGYGRLHVKKNPPHARDNYRIGELYVTDVYHMKQTTAAEHEFLILIVQVGDIDTFYLKVERTWNQPGSVSHLSSDAIEDFKGSLSDDNRSKLNAQSDESSPPSRTLPPPKVHHDSASNPGAVERFNSSFGRSSELMASSSPDAYASGPANDTVSMASPKDIQASRSTIVIEHVAFNAQVLPLIQAMGMAAAVSRKFAIYTLFNHQCYFYAATLMDCFKRSAEQAGARARVLESKNVEMGEQEVPLDGSDSTQDVAQESGWRRKGKKSHKGGRFLVIPIFEFRLKAFNGVTWPACEEYCANMTHELNEMTKSDREKDAKIVAQDAKIAAQDAKIVAQDAQLMALRRQLEEFERGRGASRSSAVVHG